MRTPFHSKPSDPLIGAIVEEDQAISATAAAEVRKRLQRRRRARQVGTIIAAMLVAAGVIVRRDLFLGSRNHDLATNDISNSSDYFVGREAAHASGSIVTRAPFVKQYSVGTQPGEELNLAASGGTEEERKLLRELNDQPTLVVWTDAGQVSRVYIFDFSR
jgi:hypothetical protein